ncbi:SC6A9-like protein [Mya arenaria]|uniref:SC6A9-like protein n=1 Tax=Mya arenaria TaxID=6604 RepID=A0ABY7F9W5_MYAAR|nr:SC6A9-like protein [Mya arenaria]
MEGESEELAFLNNTKADKCCKGSKDQTTLLQRDSKASSSASTSDTGSQEADVKIEVGNIERGLWANKLEFFLAICGYTVGIGSVWRFPIICSRNGGGAFLIPFFFFLITAGGPLYYLEVCLGQFTGKSAGLAFECCPLLKGIGVLQVMLSLTVLWYVIMVLAWVCYFLYSSFFPVLPWTTCNNQWNTPHCTPLSDMWVDDIANVHVNGSDITSNMTSIAVSSTMNSSSAFEFWEFNAIGRSSGFEEMGSMQPHLVICLLIAWVFTVLAVIKGVKTLGKVVYITATAPYLFLTIIFIKGLTMEGAADGIKTYVTPDFSKLLTFKVWLEAALQVFYSLGPSWGGVITMASYNRFHQKSFWSSTLCVIAAGFTSFYNGLVVFTMLGVMAKQSGMTVQKTASQSDVSSVPLIKFGMFETITSFLIDTFPRQLVKRRVLGGIYAFHLADWYFAAFALFVGSILEIVAVCWVYGTDRFANDIMLMTGREVSVALRVMWTIVIPFFVIYSTPTYGGWYVYSSGSVTAFMFVAMVPIIAMVFSCIHTLWNLEGTIFERLRKSLQPSEYWGPNDVRESEMYHKAYTLPSSLRSATWLNIRGNKQNL